MFMYSKMSRYGNVILTLTLLTSIYFLCHSLYLHSSNVYLSQRVDVFAAFQKNICLFYVRTISVRAFFIIWIKNLIFLDNSTGNRWLVLFSTFFRFFKFFNLKHMFVTKFAFYCSVWSTIFWSAISRYQSFQFSTSQRQQSFHTQAKPTINWYGWENYNEK